jgi:hypothetical protein
MGDKMEATWTYKNHEIKEGLKPGSKTFRYFFKILESGEKKCNYCVWIADDALDQFHPAKEFDAIVTSRKAAWQQWVKGKIDDGDFRNRALTFEKEDQQEINLSDIPDHIKPPHTR